MLAWSSQTSLLQNMQSYRSTANLVLHASNCYRTHKKSVKHFWGSISIRAYSTMLIFCLVSLSLISQGEFNRPSPIIVGLPTHFELDTRLLPNTACLTPKLDKLWWHGITVCKISSVTPLISCWCKACSYIFFSFALVDYRDLYKIHGS